MSFYDSDEELLSLAGGSSTASAKSTITDDTELCAPPPRLPPRPSVLPSLPHGPLLVGERFPTPEGLQLEFKETWGACTTSKMHETICAFLNSAGGYLMYGVQDSGKIMGISRDEADKILLRADDIFHTKKILDCETGKEPPTSAIRGSILRLCTIIQNKPHPTERFLAMLSVRNSDHNVTYRMGNGDIMIRLSASNYRSKSTTMSSYEEIIQDNRVLEAEKTKYYTERNRYRKEFMVMESSHRELSVKIKDCLLDVAAARAEAHAAVELLHARILSEKKEAERRLVVSAATPSISWLSHCFSHN